MMNCSSTPVTVVVCTLNEEANIGRCLASVQWARERFVVDAGSGDRTVELSRALGATVVTHEWSGYANQKNWALDNLPIETDWVLFLDADEYATDDLGSEIRSLVSQSDGEHAGYHVARRMIFMGRWLKRAWWYPDYNLRLFLRGRGRFEDRLVHESVVVDGSTGYLTNDLVHDDNREIAAYINRLNRYSSLEALEIHRRQWVHEAAGNRVRGSVLGSRLVRRRYVKEHIWYRLPLRPLIRFVWTSVFRLGLLDGREGLIFTLLHCVMDWYIDVKLYELRSAARRGRPAPAAMPELPPPGRL
jgi:glycosyltransferase involved in cell wall biosynthesis